MVKLVSARALTAIDHSANNAYRVLRNLGFDDDCIYYLNCEGPQDIDGNGDDEVDTAASFSDFQSAINEVKGKMENGLGTFILFLTGHGLPGQFLFDENETSESSLFDSELKDMLSGFPSGTRILIFIDSCYSGYFITSLNGISDVNRIIITGTHHDQERLWIPWLRSSDRFWGNLNKGLNVKDAFIMNAWPGEWWHLWLDDNADRIGSPPNALGDDGSLATDTQIGVPSIEDLKLTPWQFVWKCSPGELRVYDSQNRITGLVDGQVQEEIPGSIYDEENEIVAIFSPSDTYRYAVIGVGEGSYGLDIASIDGGEAIYFAAADIPTSSNATHEYTIDWAALSEGGKGVTIKIDSDGDGEFEKTITSDNDLTHDEFMLQTATVIDFDPDTLNLQSKGKFVTVYIELPLGYDVNEIDISSVMLNATITALAEPTQIDDYDSDDIPDLMVKFDRAAVQEILTPGDQVQITLSGEVAEISFKGTDIIRVIDG